MKSLMFKMNVKRLQIDFRLVPFFPGDPFIPSYNLFSLDTRPVKVHYMTQQLTNILYDTTISKSNNLIGSENTKTLLPLLRILITQYH